MRPDHTDRADRLFQRPDLGDVVFNGSAYGHRPTNAGCNQPALVRGAPEGFRLQMAVFPVPAPCLAIGLERLVIKYAVIGRKRAGYESRVRRIGD